METKVSRIEKTLPVIINKTNAALKEREKETVNSRAETAEIKLGAQKNVFTTKIKNYPNLGKQMGNPTPPRGRDSTINHHREELLRGA